MAGNATLDDRGVVQSKIECAPQESRSGNSYLKRQVPAVARGSGES
jgi:hypothetical protein